jgi:hypothetical protein
LSLQLLPFPLRISFQCVEPVEARGCPDQSRFTACRDVSEETNEPAEILREVRRHLDDRSSDARSRVGARRDAPYSRVLSEHSRQLRRDGAARTRRLAETERLPGGTRRLRRDDRGVISGGQTSADAVWHRKSPASSELAGDASPSAACHLIAASRSFTRRTPRGLCSSIGLMAVHS